jgi:hypothetical protein
MRLRPPTLPVFFNDAYPVGQKDAYVELKDGSLARRRVEGATFTYLADDSDDVAVTVTVDAEIQQGEPRCTRVVVEVGTEPLTPRLLRQVDPRWYAVYTLGLPGLALNEQGDGFTPDPGRVMERLAGAPRRRSVDVARLRQVAEAYRAGRAAGVERDCHVSRSQAYRLIALARDAGLLPKAES